MQWKLRWLMHVLYLGLLLVMVLQIVLQWHSTPGKLRQLLPAVPYPRLNGPRTYPHLNALYGDPQPDDPHMGSTTTSTKVQPSSTPLQSDSRQQSPNKNAARDYTTNNAANHNTKHNSSSTTSTTGSPGSTAEKAPVLRPPDAKDLGHLSLAKTKKTKYVWNVSMSSRDPHEVQHVIFVKVHKAASTTLYNVFLRFAVSRHLNVMLPKYGNNLLSVFSPQLGPLLPHPPSPPFLFQMLFNHVVFNHSQLRPLFPRDTRYVAIVREPWSLVQSSYAYFKPHFAYLMTSNNFIQFISNQPAYEEGLPPLMSLTNNRMSLDMGLPPEQLGNASHVRPFLRQLDAIFDLVLVMERLPESLVLMKRMLRWSFKDIVYMKLNSYSYHAIPDFTNEQLRQSFRKFQQFDYALYDYFSSVLEENISRQSSDFAEEVKAFGNVSHGVSQYCGGPSEHNASVLHVLATKWSAEFTVSRAECHILTAQELDVNFWLQLLQLERLAPRIFSGLP